MKITIEAESEEIPFGSGELTVIHTLKGVRSFGIENGKANITFKESSPSMGYNFYVDSNPMEAFILNIYPTGCGIANNINGHHVFANIPSKVLHPSEEKVRDVQNREDGKKMAKSTGWSDNPTDEGEVINESNEGGEGVLRESNE